MFPKTKKDICTNFVDPAIIFSFGKILLLLVPVNVAPYHWKYASAFILGHPVFIYNYNDRLKITVKQKGVKMFEGERKREDNTAHALVGAWRERKKETKEERRSVCT